MKISKVEYQNTFQPRSINIVIETQEELDMLNKLCLADIRVPEAVFEEDNKRYKMCQDFLDKFVKSL